MNADKKIKSYPWLREKVLINAPFQFRMIIYTAILATICVGLLYLADLFFFHKFAEAAKAMGFDKNADFSIFVSQQQELRTRIFFAVAFLDFSLLIVAGIFISHRIAGPVFRICKALSQLSENPETPEVVFRKKDYFPELSDSFNKHRIIYKELAKSIKSRAA